MAPLNGGTHGGRITALLQSGKEVIFERMGGGRGGTIKIYSDNSSSQNAGPWFQLLGNASKDLYENVYAFSLNELSNLDALDKSGVEDKIFSVGLGLASISLSEIESNLETGVDAIYSPRGKIQEIPSIFNQIQLKKQQIQQIQNNLSSYQTLVNEMEQLEQDIPSIEEEIINTNNNLKKIEDYLKCYGSYVSLQSVDEKLNQLSALQNYPADGIEQLNRLLDKKNDFEKVVEDLQGGNDKEPGVIQIQKEIETISYNEQLLNNEEIVQYLANNFEHYKHLIQSQTEDERKAQSLQMRISENIKQISSDWNENDVTSFSDLLSHYNKVHQLNIELKNIDKKKIELEADYRALKARESRINSEKLIVIIGIALAGAGIVAMLFQVIWVGIVLIAIALLLLISKKYITKENPVTEIENQLGELKVKEQKIKQEYENYLNHVLNIDKSLSPESVFELFGKIEQVKREIIEKKDLTDKIKQRTVFLKQFEEKINSLKTYLKNTSDGNIENSYFQIKTDFEDSQKLFNRKKELQRQFENKKSELEKNTENLEKVSKGIKSLLTSVHANNESEFRRKYQQNNEVNELQKEKENAIKTIEIIVGVGKDAGVIAYLSANEKETIDLEKSRLEKIISENNELYESKIDKRGAKKKEVERLEGESEVSLILTELETEKQRLTDKYKEWLAGKIALEILSEAKAKYEVEKQPEVIKKSSHYFSKITNEKYTQISASLEKKDVFIFDSNKRVRQIEQLSRGTKEQLLISLRLGFIDEYETNAEPLPIIVDEVLVNFDPVRAKRTAKILYEFAQDRQILIFTCHPITKNYFEDLPLNFVEIDKGM